MSKVKADRFRMMAAECRRQAELAMEEHEFREMQERLAHSYLALAETEDWLDGRSVAVSDMPPAPTASSGGLVEAA